MTKQILSTLLAFCIISAAASAQANAERVDSLAQTVAKQAGISEEQAEQTVKTVFSALEAELAAGREVSIRRFGRFWIQQRNARQARNPKTGAPVQVPPRRYAKFTSSDLLTDTLNSKPADKQELAKGTK